MNKDKVPAKMAICKPGNSEAFGPHSWVEALGLAGVGVVGSTKFSLADAGYHSLEPGINLMISSHNGPAVFSVLNQMLQPVRNYLTAFSSVEDIEQEQIQRARKKLHQEYECHLKSNMLPNRGYLEALARRIALLGNKSMPPLVILDQPLPGKLALAVQARPGSSFLAIHDDFTFSELLEHFRSSRGILDIDLITRSWHGQSINRALLATSEQAPILTPRAWIIVVARPEVVARFLTSEKPLLAALASCCWFLEATSVAVEPRRVSRWIEVLAKIVGRWPATPNNLIKMSAEGVKLWFQFSEEIDATLLREPSSNTGFLAQLPRMVCKLSVNHHLSGLQTSVEVTKDNIKRAIANAESHAGSRRVFLEFWRNKFEQLEFQQLCKSIIVKILAFGPMEVRELSRRYDEMPLRSLLPALFFLVRTNQLVQSGKRFDIPNRAGAGFPIIDI